MFSLFKSNDEKEIDYIVSLFMQRLGAIGNSLDDEMNIYKSLFNLGQAELVGRFNFAFYQIQIYRLLSIVDLKKDKDYSDKFGFILGKAMSSDKQIGYGAFQGLCSFIEPKNRVSLGVIGSKDALALWILNRVLDIDNPNEKQIQEIKNMISMSNKHVDQQIGLISTKFVLNSIDLAVLNAN